MSTTRDHGSSNSETVVYYLSLPRIVLSAEDNENALIDY